MTVDSIVLAIATVLAAIIGALANSFFRREKNPTKPVITFDTSEVDATISSIGLPFAEGAHTPSKIVVKEFWVSNKSDETISDLIVEYKNLNKADNEFHTLNNPSDGLLESHYEVAFHPKRQSLRYAFNCLPPHTSFKGTVTINDFWFPGSFQASSQEATVMTSGELASLGSTESKSKISQLKIIYAATVGFFSALVLALINLA